MSDGEGASRRVKVLCSYAMLTAFLQGKTQPARSSLPEDAKVVYAWEELGKQRGCALIVESKEFDLVPEFNHPPVLEVTFSTTAKPTAAAAYVVHGPEEGCICDHTPGLRPITHPACPVHRP